MRKQSITKEDIPVRVTYESPWRLSRIKPLQNYTLEVEFNDGLIGIVEMDKLVMSQNAGVFAILKDKNIFNKAYLDYGVLTWPGEIDLAPDAMHDAIKHHGKCVFE